MTNLTKAITDNASTALIIMDERQHCVFMNPAAERLTGFTLEEVRARNAPMHDVVHYLRRDGSPYPICECPIDRAFPARDRVQGEDVFIHKDGHFYDVAFSASPLRDDAGTPVGTVVEVRDITERKRSEAALARAERRFRASQEASPIAFTILHALRDAGGAIVDFEWEYVNPAAAAILKRPAELLVGRRLLQELPGNAQTSDLFATYVRVVETGVSSDYEVRYESDAIVGWFRNIAVKLDDGVAVSFADMTARRRAEEAVRLRSEQFETLIHRAPLGVYLVDADLRLAVINPLAAPAFAHCRSPLVGRNLAEVLAEGWEESYASEVLAMFHHTLATGESRTVAERQAPRRDGTAPRTYEWRLDRLSLPDGRWGAVCYFRDITEHVQAREALALAKQTAESASAAKDRFLAVLSHELRTPLTPIAMAIEIMSLEPDLPSSVREHLAMMRRNVRLEVTLIDDLLDLSRVTSGKLTLHRQPLDLRQAVAEACQICREPAREKRLRLHCEAATGPCWVNADPARLQQVLWNLLRNAVKFTPEGGEITVSTVVTSEGSLVRVRDNGIGIAPEVLPRIFDAFEQGGDGVTHQFGGLGLGLAISQSLVELHGGRLVAESAGPGQGATFTVVLPTLSPSEPADRPARPAGGAEDGRSEGLRVLLAEDHQDTATILARLLTKKGHHVRIAPCVAEALRLSAAETFEVLVSDIGLPDGTGYELMRELGARYGMAGIAMSGYGMEEDVRQSRAAGFSEHLVKPVSADHLLRALRRLEEARGTPTRG